MNNTFHFMRFVNVMFIDANYMLCKEQLSWNPIV